jgi:hypothetical protein
MSKTIRVFFCPDARKCAADGPRRNGILPSAKTWARRPLACMGAKSTAMHEEVPFDVFKTSENSSHNEPTIRYWLLPIRS